MKRAAFWVFLFLAGMGFILVVDMTLGALWISLEWRKPIADWLLSSGVPSALVGHWGLVWINIPDWLALVLLGAFIGRRVDPSRWLRYALVLGGGLITYSLLQSMSYLLMLAESDRSLAVGTFWRLLVWKLISVLLLILATWLFNRPRRNVLPQATVEAES